MTLMDRILRMVTWWNGSTVGTDVYTSRYGKLVGQDEEGNRFFQTADGKRRWVIYNGEAEASRVSPDWHGWLHHTWEEPPTEVPLPRKAWEKPHVPNRTGTDAAYHPPGSVLTSTVRAPATGDYEAWRPE